MLIAAGMAACGAMFMPAGRRRSEAKDPQKRRAQRICLSAIGPERIIDRAAPSRTADLPLTLM
ncbi:MULTISPECIES: hypothetical protein [unclassified Nonomuraea]|uniref:hypothetical protein n=1 Tax=unclassified Nonomuraea TaxID=2593643 RepID=UPI0033CA99F9